MRHSQTIPLITENAHHHVEQKLQCQQPPPASDSVPMHGGDRPGSRAALRQSLSCRTVRRLLSTRRCRPKHIVHSQFTQYLCVDALAIGFHDEIGLNKNKVTDTARPNNSINAFFWYNHSAQRDRRICQVLVCHNSSEIAASLKSLHIPSV